MVIGAWQKSPGSWRGLCLALALFAISGGCAADQAERKRDGERTMNEGFLALNTGNTTLALDLFLKAEKIDPSNPYIHYNLGITYWAKDMPDKAEPQFKEAIRLKPDYSEAYNYLGVIYLNRGQTDQAIECFQKALSNVLYLNPENAHFNLGRAYLARNDYPRAVEQLERAVKLVPDFAMAHNALGEAYEGMKRDADAKRSYKSAIQFAPNFVQAHWNLGKLLYRTDERAEARKELNEVIRLSPDSREANEARAMLKMMK